MPRAFHFLFLLAFLFVIGSCAHDSKSTDTAMETSDSTTTGKGHKIDPSQIKTKEEAGKKPGGDLNPGKTRPVPAGDNEGLPMSDVYKGPKNEILLVRYMPLQRQVGITMPKESKEIFLTQSASGAFDRNGIFKGVNMSWQSKGNGGILIVNGKATNFSGL